MSFNIEIIGLPASGKTYFYKYLIKILKRRKNIEIKSLKEAFVLDYINKKTKVHLLKKTIYSYYIKNIQVKSNFLFKKEYKDLNNFIKQSLKKNKYFFKIINLYNKYLNTSNYSKERKFRMIKNFEIEYLGARSIPCKSGFSVFDEGFFQKIYINYQSNNNLNFSFKNQMNYLKLVPKPDLILLFNTSIQTCLQRAKKRKDGFLYEINGIKYVKEGNYFNNSVIKYANDNKIPIFKLDGAKSLKTNINIFIKIIKNYKK